MTEATFVTASGLKVRKQTRKVLEMRKGHHYRNDRYRAIAPPEEGRSGPVYTSIAYGFENAEQAAQLFGGQVDGYAYPRLSCGTPPIHQLSERLLKLEFGDEYEKRKGEYDVLLAASGMSATMMLALSLADNGREFISSPRIYGGTYNLFDDFFARLNISCVMVNDPLDYEEWYRACEAHPRATFLFAEDDANPTPIKLNNRALAHVAHEYGKLYICDRTIGTPLLERPLLTGTDAVVHSLSKNIGGFSGGLGGAIIGRKKIIQDIRDGWFIVMGAVMDPRVADYMLEGMRSLEDRIATKQKSLAMVVPYLKQHARVTCVYATESDLLAFEIRGTRDDARRVVESYKLIIFAPHLGDIQTISTHPASTTHSRVPPEEREKLGISDTLIRLSIGLEDPQDIIDDIDQALARGVRSQ